MIGCTYKSERTLAYDIIYVRYRGAELVDFSFHKCFYLLKYVDAPDVMELIIHDHGFRSTRYNWYKLYRATTALSV